ncbi:MAG TPA: hypothetical protein DCZ95_15285 [Verrucomicrobia bacterium]|nr:MAG: hypothetical protein A2X46_19040 [Lentisphaerae bacterium GWF2_57_35]HBA85448.1 hypothetical protein [Verrucomicrobiota bacterium]
MKKLIAGLLIAVFLLGAVESTMAATTGRGGFMGFIAGCCFGVRAAGAYNDGKNIHWREWLSLIIVGNIWDGIEGAKGVTSSDLVTRYGATYY